MIGFRAVSTLLIFMLFFVGCTHNGAIPKPQPAPNTEHTLSETAAGSNTVELPENDENALYGIGEGSDEREAKERAIRDLNGRVWSEFTAGIDSDINRKPIYRYITKKRIEKAKRVLRSIPLSEYTVFKSHTRKEGTVVVLVELRRAELSKRFKRDLLRRLVPIEERWHSSRKKSPVERYLVAKDSFVKMVDMLPEYLFADYITPFPAPIAERVERGTPYFERTAARLKRGLKFCIEPVSTPAMKFFADAVENVLRNKRVLHLNGSRTDGSTLCITLKGELVHKRRAQKHIFEGRVELALHKRYRAPLSIQSYTVRGESEESGTKALQKAAREFQKELRKRFFQAV